MNLLVRATALIGRPVVTLAGDDVAEIKDVVYDASSGAVGGFTLNSRGLFGGPLKEELPIAGGMAIGPDAVMIADRSALRERGSVADPVEVRERNVLGNRVVTDTGTELGTVVDVILEVGRVADVVGYEVRPHTAPRAQGGQTVLVPLPDALAVSGEALIVPGGAVEFISHDLAGFGAAVTAFRAHLEGDGDAVQ